MWQIYPWPFFFFQAEDGIRDLTVTGVQTCALPILFGAERPSPPGRHGGRAPDGVAGDLARLPQADEQDALRLGAGRVEQRRLVALSLEVAARNDARHDTARRAVQVDRKSTRLNSSH